MADPHLTHDPPLLAEHSIHDARRARSRLTLQVLLHAKAVIADGRLAFVSSANLTGSGLEHNLELGILIRGGPVPRRIAEHFTSLIAAGVLQRS